MDIYKNLQFTPNNYNQIIADYKKISFINSEIVFHGHNNKIIIEDDTRFLNSQIIFFGNNSYIYISKSIHNIMLIAHIFNDNKIYIGKNNYFNGILSLSASEQKCISIGDNCLLSHGIKIRTADPHLIYDINTKLRINYSKDVIIGDHVWIGENVTILKGSFICSGSVIGSNSVITSSNIIRSNEIWAGNPAKKVRDEVLWQGNCVHLWTRETSEKFNYTTSNNNYIFKKDRFTLEYKNILSWILNIQNYNHHNRFGN